MKEISFSLGDSVFIALRQAHTKIFFKSFQIFTMWETTNKMLL